MEELRGSLFRDYASPENSLTKIKSFVKKSTTFLLKRVKRGYWMISWKSKNRELNLKFF